MLAASDVIYSAFGTHNAFTISAILELAQRHDCKAYEFQRLHGMGQQLYDAAYATDKAMPPCRVYAPVGAHNDLLPYLVRRLLENGANSSFVHQVYDTYLPVESLTENPAKYIAAQKSKPHPQIPLPMNIYGDRLNSVAPDISDREERTDLLASLAKKRDIKVTTTANADELMQKAQKAFGPWKNLYPTERAKIIDKIADLYEQHRDDLLALCIQEGKKTLNDAVAEWREAIDFCRYYAHQVRNKFVDEVLPGPTGERNILQIEGRGVFVCISPWNFPLAIFTGQVVAALVSGNAVIAKPAEQTPKIAAFAVDLMHQARVPKDVMQLAVGEGGKIGAALTSHKLTAGIAFTGSTETAWIIQSALAQKRGPIIPFIAETGGQNAMIVDSTALPEQVVDDVIRSAFLSAGQRCSALRVLYLQDDIAPNVIDMLKGAMQELVIHDASDPATDIGPVIDNEARDNLQQHAQDLKDKQICSAIMPDGLKDSFILPQVFKINSIKELDKENFGPLLHVITYKAKDLDRVIDEINATGFGLTLGIHSRVEGLADKIAAKVNAGNIYINRGMTGAVVGVQPFGGMGLSGTGPKAGGPHYLYRFVTEKTVSINTTAAGGNTTLTTLSDNTP
jgi:RHH-type proline utilization regulon transcriptional repressor/proline dehydrogenase/delta 1-pyrroline-5-carboxylate dehydrogenase